MCAKHLKKGFWATRIVIVECENVGRNESPFDQTHSIDISVGILVACIHTFAHDLIPQKSGEVNASY